MHEMIGHELKYQHQRRKENFNSSLRFWGTNETVSRSKCSNFLIREMWESSRWFYSKSDSSNSFTCLCHQCLQNDLLESFEFCFTLIRGKNVTMEGHQKVSKKRSQILLDVAQMWRKWEFMMVICSIVSHIIQHYFKNLNTVHFGAKYFKTYKKVVKDGYLFNSKSHYLTLLWWQF